MGDMAEGFREMTAARKAKRRSNTEHSTRWLIQKGIKFKSNNGGAHLVIDEPNTGIIDFWPATGLWIPRSTKKKSRGIRPLVNYILGNTK